MMSGAQSATIRKTHFRHSAALKGEDATSYDSNGPEQPQSAQPEAVGYFVQIPLELIQEYDISAAAFKLFVVLKSYARQFDKCWPSHQTLAYDMHLKPRRIRDLLKELETVDLVQVESHSEEGRPNLYHLKKFTLRPASSTASPHSNQPASTENKTKTITRPVKNNRPARPNIACLPRQVTAYELHETTLHETTLHENTPEGAEPQTITGIELDKECVTTGKTFEQINPNSNFTTQQIVPFEKTEPDHNPRAERGYEALLKARVSPQLALRLCRIAYANGRAEDYLERWVVIARTKNNPAAYLKTVILDNAEPGPVRFPTGRFTSELQRVGVSSIPTGKLTELNQRGLQHSDGPLDLTRYSHLVPLDQAEEEQGEATTEEFKPLTSDLPVDEVASKPGEIKTIQPLQLADYQNYWLRESLRQLGQKYEWNLRKTELTEQGTLRAWFYNAAQEPSLTDWLPILQRCCPQVRQIEVMRR